MDAIKAASIFALYLFDVAEAIDLAAAGARVGGSTRARLAPKAPAPAYFQYQEPPILFDGNTRDARLNGIEYIIAEKLFDTLPEGERALWHPHNGEILSGQLIAPALPAAAEKALMRQKMNSYGKTWHVWHTGHEGMAGDKLPLGPPMLAWSFNRDGEVQPGLVAQRDRSLRIDSADKRRRRADLQGLAHPQSGVDDLKAAFPQARPLPGVVDRNAAGGPAPASAPAR